MVMKAAKEDRVVEFIASKEVVDRGGDLVKVKGVDLKDFKKNPVIMWSHMHDAPPIAKAVSMRKSGDELKMKVQFATSEEYGFADTIYKLIKGGYINATSIGIIPDYESMEYPGGKELNGKKVRRIINKSSLIELSILPIPMNQDALRTKALNKAIQDGVIDDVELKEFEMMSQDVEKNPEQTNTNETLSKDDIANKLKDFGYTVEELNMITKGKEYKKEVIELKARIAELELQLAEKEMEIEEEDSIYKDLYDEFTETKNIDKTVIDELFDEYVDIDKDDNSTIDELYDEFIKDDK